LLSAAIISVGLYKNNSQNQNLQDNISLVKKEEQNLTVTPIIEKNTSPTTTQTYTPTPRPPVRTSAS
jgi:hypothetical protein